MRIATAESLKTPAPGANNTPVYAETAFPAPIVTITATLSATKQPASSKYNYVAQSGDTLAAVARRFQVDPAQIQSNDPLTASGFLTPGQSLIVPVSTQPDPIMKNILPDSEVIFSSTANDFNIASFINSQGGFLSTYTESVYGKEMSGTEIIQRVAQESSVNPRLLLAFLEFRSGWVSGQPRNQGDLRWPLGFNLPDYTGLYQELAIAATHLNIGYYGWRVGQFNQFKYSNGETGPVNPWLNAGSVGIQNLFAKFYDPGTWRNALYGPNNFSELYQKLFGDPWARAAAVEPLFVPGLAQPTLELPFASGERWSLTGGPHASWNSFYPRGALDFAPVTGEPNCSVSRAWVTASANGVIARSANNVVALDLDGDGNEQTGWVVVYVHLADADLLPAGTKVHTNDRIGHPSCERGHATGTHVHIARKYNGEWLEGDGPLPFILSGWRVSAGEQNYQGSLLKGDKVVMANPNGPRSSIIVR